MVPGLAPVNGYVQKFDAMWFRSLASTITLSLVTRWGVL